MRKDEILGPRWDQIDIKTDLITLSKKETKEKNPKRIPINQSADPGTRFLVLPY
jgi:hypothetical protein